uniref:RRM domain-containing protein n=1 Tax=Psilocybe cubensis TaxID=181762 RepID=A0A8H7Y7Y5_PSICU
MAAPNAVDDSSIPPENWGPQDDQSTGPAGNSQSATGTSLPVDDRSTGQDPENSDYPRGSSVPDNETFREKQVKPNKVYIGGLPENTRQEDLQGCFGKIGNIVNIELKVGYGFVEFDSREAAEESVAKYNDGFFMGNRVRVELSHGGGRTAKFAGDPGACFKCGNMGHWASVHRRANYEPPLIDRIQRDYNSNPRNIHPRDDFTQQRMPPRDGRFDYPPPPNAMRDHRRPPSPREYRDYGPPLPPNPRPRDYDDFRRGPPVDDRDRFPPPPDFRGRYPSASDPPYRGYGPPVNSYDRYDRRPNDRYTPYSQQIGQRPRTPPRVRDEYDRLAPRDYPEYRGRPATPPRYPPDYNRLNGNSPTVRYGRRSASPPRTSGPPPYDAYSVNGYMPGPIAPPVAPPPRGNRDYPPRNGRDMIEPVGAYRRP